MFCLCVIAVNSSETLVMSTPVTERLQRHTADTVSRQTNPDDRKFVVRLKTPVSYTHLTLPTILRV